MMKENLFLVFFLFHLLDISYYTKLSIPAIQCNEFADSFPKVTEDARKTNQEGIHDIQALQAATHFVSGNFPTGADNSRISTSKNCSSICVSSQHSFREYSKINPSSIPRR